MFTAIASAGIGDPTPVGSKISLTLKEAINSLGTFVTGMTFSDYCDSSLRELNLDLAITATSRLALINEITNDNTYAALPKVTLIGSALHARDKVLYADAAIGKAKISWSNWGNYGKNDPLASGKAKISWGNWGNYGKNDPFASGKAKISWGNWGNFGKNDPYASKSAQLKDKLTRSALILWKTNYETSPHFDGEIDLYTKDDKLDDSPIKPTRKVYPLSSYKLGIRFAKSVPDAFSWGQEKIFKNTWDYPSISSYEFDIGLVKSITKAAAWIEGGIDAIDNIVSLFHGAYKEGPAIVGEEAIASKDPVLSFVDPNDTVLSQLLAAINIGGDLVTKGIDNWVGVKTIPHEGFTLFYSEIKA